MVQAEEGRRQMIFVQLFVTFFLIGMFTFGGGYAMLSLIQTEVVANHAWLSESMFTDIVAISQMTPGPIGINCATYTGYEVLHTSGAGELLSVLGSCTATAAIVLPSFIIMLLIVRMYLKYKSSDTFTRIMGSVRPAVTGLIGAAALILIFNVSWSGGVPTFSIVRDNFPDWKSWVLLAAALAASLGGKVKPIPMIVAGAVAGLIIY